MRSLRFGLVLGAAIAGGCAGMSAEECQLADWQTIGYEDGVAGYSGDAIARHRKSCAKAGVQPDRAAYELGRAEGLESYCDPINGYRVGVNGGTYRGVCNAEMEPSFLTAYHEGRELHRLRSDVGQLTSRLNYQHRMIADQKEEILDIEKALIADETTPEARIALLLDLKEASRELGELENEVYQIERDRAMAEAALRDYEENHSYSASLF